MLNYANQRGVLVGYKPGDDNVGCGCAASLFWDKVKSL